MVMVSSSSALIATRWPHILTSQVNTDDASLDLSTRVEAGTEGSHTLRGRTGGCATTSQSASEGSMLRRCVCRSYSPAPLVVCASCEQSVLPLSEDLLTIRT